MLLQVHVERTLKILWALSLWQTGTLGLSAAAFTTAFLESFITIFTKEFSPFQSGCWHGNCSPPPTCDCGAMDGADASSYPYGLTAGAAANVPTFHRASAWMSQTTNGKNKDWPSWVSEQGSPPSMYEKYHESPPPLDVTDYIKKHPKNCTIDATTVFACGTAREYYDPASPVQCCITTAQQAGEGAGFCYPSRGPMREDQWCAQTYSPEYGWSEGLTNAEPFHYAAGVCCP